VFNLASLCTAWIDVRTPSKEKVMEVNTLLMTAATVALAGIGGLYYSFACSVMPARRGDRG
jgi:hypothetical protein